MAHKLLLADDSVTIQRVIELTFADEAIQVVAVGDGRQAIEQLQRDRPDIVLADVGMPEHDGYEVAAFIKGNAAYAHIPVLLLTGAFEPIDEARAKAVGCDGVLVKPFEPQMVINRVKDLLAGRKPASLWATTPTPGSAPAPAGGHFPAQPAAAAAPPPPPGGSLEDYFDRLDAAFATHDAAPPDAPRRVEAAAPHVAMPPPPPRHAVPPEHLPPAAPFGVGDDLAGWDPDLSGDPSRPAVEAPRAEPPAPVFTPAPTPAPMAASPAVAAVAIEPPPPASTAPTAPPEEAAAPVAAPSLREGRMPSLAAAFAALLAAEQGQSLSPAIAVPQSVPDPVVEDIVRRVIDRMSDRAVRDTVVDVAERLVREEIARIKGTPNP